MGDEVLVGHMVLVRGVLVSVEEELVCNEVLVEEELVRNEVLVGHMLE